MKKISLVLASMFVLSGCDKLGLNNMFKKLMFWNNIYKEVSEDEFIERFMETANKYNIVLKDSDFKQFAVSSGHNGKITNVEKMHIAIEENGKEKLFQDDVETNEEFTMSQDLHVDLKNNSGYSKQYSKEVGESSNEYKAEVWMANNKEYHKEEGKQIEIEDYEGEFIDDFNFYMVNILNSGALRGIVSKTFYSFGAIIYNTEPVIPDSFKVKYELSKTGYRYSLEYSITNETEEYKMTTLYKETLSGGNFLVDECSIFRSTQANSDDGDSNMESTTNLHYVIDYNIQIPNLSY